MRAATAARSDGCQFTGLWPYIGISFLSPDQSTGLSRPLNNKLWRFLLPDITFQAAAAGFNISENPGEPKAISIGPAGRLLIINYSTPSSASKDAIPRRPCRRLLGDHRRQQTSFLDQVHFSRCRPRCDALIATISN